MKHLHPRRTTGCCHHLMRWLATLATALSCQAAIAVGPYTYSALGDEVTDTATGLVWKRCSVGQTWSGGICSGTAASMPHEAALTHAAGQTGWRLPNVKELASLVDSSRSSPAINMVAFPNTTNDYYWSASPYARNTNAAWVVSFFDGKVFSIGSGSVSSYRTYNFHVRLVR
jgi:hypothetical protein